MEFLEWLTSNELLIYPLSEDSTLTNGSQEIPTDLFIDAVIYGNTGTYYISRIFQDGANLLVDVSQDGNLIFTIEALHTEDTIRQVITVASIYDNIPHIGRFVFGAGLLKIFPTTEEMYTEAQAKFTPGICVPQQTQIHSLGIYNNDQQPVLLDDIKLLGGCNINLEQGTTLTLSTGPNDSCECETSETRPYYISTINGVFSNLGNFKIEGSECVNVYSEPSHNMVVITNECKPCCEDCDDRVNEFNYNLGQVQTNITSISNRVSALGG